MSTSADIALERRGGWIVARLSGEVDMTNATFVRDELTGQIPNDVEGMVIDLGATRYLDSAAVEMVFELARRLGRRRQELRLAVPEASALRRLLGLTGVAAVAPVHESAEAALAGS